jgi:3-hydroxy acid dehydrogenase / malonic semialdehyde reductase
LLEEDVSHFRGEICFITGASAGIGKAAARAFAKEGCRLVLAARRRDRLEELARELETAHGTRSYFAVLDVRDRAAVLAFVDSAERDFGPIDILINNAGLAHGVERLADNEETTWRVMLETNVAGVLHVLRAVLPRMIERDRGHVLNLGSVAGHEVYEGGAAYTASKHALDAITRTLRLELLGTPIRVTTVDPGLVETEFSMVRFDGDAERAKRVYEGLTPLSGEDIADCLLWAATRPTHVNIDAIDVKPVAQASATRTARKT